MNIAQNAKKLLSLEDKIAVISGGASGIGLSTAKKFLKFGASVAILDIDKKGQKICESLSKKGQATFIQCDVSKAEDCKSAVNQITERWNQIDILFNNAGVAIRKDAVDLEPEEWDKALDVSLKGQYLLTKYTVPAMKKSGGGSIINSGSGWSLRGGENAVSYCAMKGGTLNMTRAMSIDYGENNIRVNTVCPGDVDTPMLKSECEQLGQTYNDEFKEKCAEERPLNRIGTPEDIANTVLFLASDMSAWITGAHIVVDGGGIAG